MPYSLKSLIPVFLTVAFFSSCNSDKNDYTAYFGGEVTNPNGDCVLLSRNDKIIDTLRLDENNRFFIKFDSLTPGLYAFRHEPDYQYVYFDKNDSLLVSINADKFDESIVFTGRGESKNNFLMELYLMNEDDRDKSYRIYEEPYNIFSEQAEKSFALRQDFYNKSKNKIEWNDDFDFYANYRLRLSQYTKKEYYPYLHARRTGKSISGQLPDDYYSFRKDIDFEDPRLTHFSPFLRYVNALLSNMSYERGERTGSLEKIILDDSIEKLYLADSIFKNKDVKNDILDNIAFSYLLENQAPENNKKFLTHYTKLTKNRSQSNEIMQIAHAIDNMTEGNKLPEVKLVDTANAPFSIDSTYGDKTVIYFWTSCALSHYRTVQDKIHTLKKQFPDVEFLAVNVDKSPNWYKAVKKDDSIMLLRATNFEALKDEWAVNQLNRTIILNDDGTIKNGFTDLMDDKFAEYLK